tara:strand:- start:878 stop:2689 length:1812 start_codon:yes stop_codon:yes gene_type:complete
MSIKTQRLLIKAKKLIIKNKFEEAKSIYQKILDSFPNNKAAKKGLLSLNKNLENDLSQAELEEVIKLYSSGKILDALQKNKDLIKKYPNEPTLFNISGVCYLAISKKELAADSFIKSIELNPEYYEGHYNLGITLQEQDQLNEAIESYKTAIKIKHDYPAAHNNLGLIYLKLSRPDFAITHFEFAIKYMPEFAEAHNNLGAALQEVKQYKESIKSYEKALFIRPNYIEALNNLGIIAQTLGDKNTAIKHYEKAISLQEDFATAHHNLSALKKFYKDDPQIKQIKALLSKDNLNISQQIFLNFALSKAHDDTNNPNELFAALNKGNKLRKIQLNYNLKKDQDKFLNIKDIFKTPQPNISESLQNKPLTKRPIFIVGMPRSGTTLVEQIVASHKDVYGADEMNTMSKLSNQILNQPPFESIDKTKESYLQLRGQYLDAFSNFNISENVITDKWPLNFQYIGIILTAFPEAKIIHLERDARAICWSIYKHYFSDNGNGWSYNQNDLVGFYKLYSDLMTFWHELFPNQIYDICYERLTSNQKEETQKLLEYCDLNWDEKCLNFHSNNRAVKTASALQVRRKMYQGSSEVWKKYTEYLKPIIDGLNSY